MRTIAKVIFLTLISFSALAGPSNKPSATPAPEHEVYKTVTPFGAEDDLSVIVFFKYDCPVCRNYHPIIDHWGSSLPKEFIFQFIPAVEGDGVRAIAMSSGFGMLGFWTAELSGNRQQRQMFAEEMYMLFQDRRVKIDMERIFESANSARIPFNKWRSAWDKNLKIGDGYLKRQIHYKPTSTPTVVICGKYMVTPDNALGNQDTFMQLLNGLVSKCMSEKGIKPKNTYSN